MKVCIISPEAVGPFSNGGVGTHATNLAAFLGARKSVAAVTLLYTGRIDTGDLKSWKAHYRREFRTEFEWIDPDHLRKEVAPKSAGMKCPEDLVSQAVLDFLVEQEFDVCFFQDMMGTGFRAMQAKRTGLALGNTLLTCMAHSSSRWVHESMRLQPPFGAMRSLVMYMERYSVRHCDVLLSPSEYMLDWCAGDVESLPEKRHVLPYLTHPPIREAGMRPPSGKLIFFGRLEQRKGLVVFLDALQLLLDAKDLPPLEVHFLGKYGRTLDGDAKVTLARYRERFGDAVKIVTITDRGHDEALDYLREHNDAVVVCPSLVDNSPNAILEAIQMRLNLVSCATGGIPELFSNRDRLCEPESAVLAELIARALRNELPPIQSPYTPEMAAVAWNEFLDQCTGPDRSGSRDVSRLAVLVAGSAGNPEHEAQTEAIRSQTFKDFDVIEISETSGVPSSTGNQPVVLLPVGCLPAPDAFECVAKAFAACPEEGLMAWSTVTRRVGRSQSVRVAGYGPVNEVALFGNFYGLGWLALRFADALDPQTLHDVIFSPRKAWPTLTRLFAGKGVGFEVIPRELSDNAVPPVVLSANAHTYDDQMAVASILTEGLPRWQRRFFENTTGAEMRTPTPPSSKGQASMQSGQESPEAPFLRKLERYLREWRILPSMAQTEIFPEIEDELAPFKQYFTGNVLNAGAGDRDISHFVEGKLFNQDIPEGGHTDNIHIYSPLHEIPRDDGFFDAIICNAVMEHVRNPEEVMQEFNRVCKKGGHLFLAIPFMQPEHKDPTDFQRYTQDGICELAKRHGFEVLHVDGIHSVYTTMAWICRNWLTSRTSLSYFLLKLILFPYLKWKVKSSRYQVNSLQSAYRVLARKIA